jgi:hypothetical protein
MRCGRSPAGIALAAVVAIALQASCLGDIDYTGKLCSAESTCPGGWTCDRGTCSRGGVDAGDPSLTPQCTGTFQVKDFHAAWQTSTNVRWEWEPLGTAEAFGRYEIQMDPSQERVEAGEASVRLDSQANVELGFMNLPATTGIVAVKASVAYGLTPPGSQWFGRLLAFDRFGCAFKTAVVGAQLLDPPSYSAVLFDDALRPGSSLRPATSSGDSHGRLAVRPDCDGSACLEYVADRPGGENLVLETEIAPSELASLTRGRFEQAFLELRIWVDSNDALWTGLWIVNGNGRIFRFEPYSPVRSSKSPLQSSYRVVQVPLRELDDSGAKLTVSDLASGIIQFRFYASFGAGTRAWLDDIVVRW